VVLDFDHHGNKAFEIGEALTYRRWETILAEIARCDVVCATAIDAGEHDFADLFGPPWPPCESSLSRAGDRTRTGTESLEGSSAAVTPRPRGVLG
jgi:hypothetical protein